MKIKSFFIYTTFFIFAFQPLSIYASNSNKIDELDKNIKDSSVNIDDNLTTDYFKRIPESFYILGSGDTLSISISRNHPELYSVVTINGEGTIFLPIVNKIFIKGLTVDELGELLKEEYSKSVKFDDIEINVVGYRPISINVIGEVNTPGFHSLQGSINAEIQNRAPITYQTYNEPNEDVENYKNFFKDIKPKSTNYYFPTVFDGIRESGGLTKFADISNVEVIRKNKISSGEGKIITTLNFSEKFYKENVNQNIRIMDGDIINIKRLNKIDANTVLNNFKTNLTPKYISVFVTGRVNAAGLKYVSNLSTLNDAIDIAGGAKVLKGPITYLSFNKDGLISKSKFRYSRNAKRGSKKNPYLRESDLIIVGNSLLSNTSEIISEVTMPFVGAFSSYGLFKAINEEF